MGYPYVQFDVIGGSGAIMTFNGPTADSDGDDITGVATVSSNPAVDYDANGWLQVTLSGYMSGTVTTVTTNQRPFPRRLRVLSSDLDRDYGRRE